MNILVICSGSMGHYYGIKRFFDYIELGSEHNILYAFHGFNPEIGDSDPSRYHIPSFPAFLNYEFRYTKKIREIIKLKQHNYLLQNRTRTLFELFDYFIPDVILLDNHAFTDGFVLKKEFGKLGFNVVFFQTRLSTELSMNSAYGSHYFGKLKWLPSQKILLRQRVHELKYRLMMPGFNKYRQLDQYRKDISLNLNMKRYRLPTISKIPEILFSGVNLSQYQTENQKYMGLCIKPKWPGVKKSEKFQIMVSAGSVLNKLQYLDKFKKTIQNLIQRNPQYHFAVPNGFKVPTNSNTSFYTWDQYQDVLGQSHIHIAHGGFNSIKDSLSYAVPLLICPLDWESDQIQNALFIEESKLSLTWNIRRDKVDDVITKLEIIAIDNYSKRIQSFVLNDNSSYPPKKIKDEFSDLIQDPKWEIRNW